MFFPEALTKTHTPTPLSHKEQKRKENSSFHMAKATASNLQKKDLSCLEKIKRKQL